MKNLENNKIYKLGQISLFSVLALSFLVMIIRLFSPSIALDLSFLSPHLIWRYFDMGMISYEETPQIDVLARLIVSCGLFVCIYAVCLFLSKRNLYYLVGALCLYVFDALFFAYEVMIQVDATRLLVSGLIFKFIIISIMSVAVFYGYIGKRIEDDDDISESPDVKYINKWFSSDLANQKRKIILKRNKSLINSYIYLQIILDGKTVCYLKNGESFEIEGDANQHTLLVVCHFENIEPIRRRVSMGTDDYSFIISIERKFLFKKSLKISKQ